MAKITSAKNYFLVSFIFLVLGIFFLLPLNLTVGLSRNNPAYYKYMFLHRLGFPLIIVALVLTTIHLFDLTKRKMPANEYFQRKSTLREAVFILVGIILILIFPGFALFSEGGWDTGIMAISILFFGIILLTIGIMLRLRK